MATGGYTIKYFLHSAAGAFGAALFETIFFSFWANIMGSVQNIRPISVVIFEQWIRFLL